MVKLYVYAMHNKQDIDSISMESGDTESKNVCKPWCVNFTKVREEHKLFN